MLCNANTKCCLCILLRGQHRGVNCLCMFRRDLVMIPHLLISSVSSDCVSISFYKDQQGLDCLLAKGVHCHK